MESRWIPKTSENNFRGQNSMSCGVLYIIRNLLERMFKMGSHCSFGHLKHKLWPKEGPGVKLPVWLLTRKSRESTRFTYLQMVCNIPLESSRQELQLCFRLHFDLRSTRKVMGLQSCRSPNLGDFKESQDEKPFGCGPYGEVQSIL
jgi:hypothetical protein